MRIRNLKLRIKQGGFTLVELLVVIGVLGILAAGLLATIDPLEQLRKGRDSNAKSTAVELVKALNRYYFTRNVAPWASTATGGDNCLTSAPSGIQVSPSFATCLTALRNQGELKSTFLEQTAILQKLYVSDITSGSTVAFAVCFDPDSKAEAKRPETKYDQYAIAQAANVCVWEGGDNEGCFWCAR